jgi:hypothetical protein
MARSASPERHEEFEMELRGFRRALAVAVSLLLLSSSAGAVVLPFVGELALEVRPAQAAVAAPGSGSVVANPLGGLHLTQASVPGGVFAANAAIVPVTDPAVFPIAGLQLTVSQDPGVLAGGPLGGAIPLGGFLKVCLFARCGTGVIANIEIPLSVVGDGGVVVHPPAPGPVNVTVIGAPWTTGTAVVGAATAQGSAMGPASLASSTAQLGGTLNAVTPIFVSTDIPPMPLLPTFARMQMLFGGTSACSDGSDNDADGLTDYPADPGCLAANDLSEHEQGVECDDGFENDGDGLIDHPADPGCTSLTDTSEVGDSVCDNGVDDDGDGAVDAHDPGCDAPGDDSELSAALPCDNGVDDDDDGDVDLDDFQCKSLLDPSEFPVCSDGVDNDGDGYVDYPADPGCRDETGFEQSKCQDGIDNDGDGGLDFDGGASRNGGVPIGPADPTCAEGWYYGESSACGLGAELVLVLAALWRWRRRATAA